MPGIWVVVPAAGRGTRFGGEVPKQYLAVAGQPLIAHALAALLAHPAVEGAMVAISENDPDWPGWTSFLDKPVLTCIGGATRARSVSAALDALPAEVKADDFVLVHDAARPNLGQNDLQQLLERGLNDPVGAIVRHHDLDLDLGQEADVVLSATIDFRLALLAAIALHFRDGHALQAEIGEGRADLLEFERLDDGGDQLHDAPGSQRLPALAAA